MKSWWKAERKQSRKEAFCFKAHNVQGICVIPFMKFIEQRNCKPHVTQAYDRLDKEMYEIRRKKMRQLTIL